MIDGFERSFLQPFHASILAMLKGTAVLIFLLLIASTALADSFKPPCPRSIESEDKRFTLILIPVKKDRECEGRDADHVAAAKAIREKYTQNGLYEGSDPGKLRWPVSESWDYDRVLIANDGVHMVRIPIFGSRSNDVGIVIYENGEQTHEILIRDLVKDTSKITYTTSMAIWAKTSSMDNANSKFRVQTVDGLDYQVDLATGVPRSVDSTLHDSTTPSSKENTNSVSNETAPIACNAVMFVFFSTAFIGVIGRKLSRSAA